MNARRAMDFAITVREMLYRLASPVDAAVGAALGREAMPPLWLRRHVGAAVPGEFRAAAAAGAMQLRELFPHPAFRSVLDLGCGCGAMVPYFRETLPSAGRYLGLDKHRGCLHWAQRRWAADQRIRFAHVHEAAPLTAGAPFDLVLAKSLFTHLVAGEAEAMLQLIRAHMAAGGYLVLTVFLHDHQGITPMFPHAAGDGFVRYRRRMRPAAAVTFDRDFFLALLSAAGFRVERAWYWFWPGDQSRIRNQDLLLCRPDGDRAACPS